MRCSPGSPGEGSRDMADKLREITQERDELLRWKAEAEEKHEKELFEAEQRAGSGKGKGVDPKAGFTVAGVGSRGASSQPGALFLAGRHETRKPAEARTEAASRGGF